MCGGQAQLNEPLCYRHNCDWFTLSDSVAFCLFLEYFFLVTYLLLDVGAFLTIINIFSSKLCVYLVNCWCIHHPIGGDHQMDHRVAACNLTGTWMPARSATESLRQTLIITIITYTYSHTLCYVCIQVSMLCNGIHIKLLLLQ